MPRAPSSFLPDQQAARRKLPGILENRQRGRDEHESKVGVERFEVDLPRKARLADERLELGAEREASSRRAVVERLDPEAIAREHEPALAAVPESYGEHPAQPVDKAGTVLLVEVHEHLGVALRGKPMTLGLQLRPLFPVVVDLAVLDDPDRAVFVADGLVAAGEVDDRQAPSGQTDVPVDERAPAVRSSVKQRFVHRLEDCRVHRATVERHQTADPAHVSECSSVRRQGRSAACRGRVSA